MTTAFDIDVEPLTLPVLIPGATAEPIAGPAVASADQARDLVALHAAATLVPSATLTERERIRTAWLTALDVVWRAGQPGDDWALVYLPGLHHDDNDTYAVHKTSGRVLGGDCPSTGQRPGESTAAWLDRLA